MHIRDKFYTWIDVSSTRTPRAFCGARTREGLIGVPGVTQGEQKWCGKCCHKALEAVEGLDLPSITSPEVEAVYNKFVTIIKDRAKEYREDNKFSV